MRFLAIYIMLAFIGGCSYPTENVNVQVKHAGALKNFMNNGDISAKALLDTLKPTDLYALGALEKLKGELIILDGEPYLSRKIDDKLVVEKSYNAKAALLVYSYVEEWNEYKIKESVNSKGELESLVEEIAIRQGINIENPFPFMLKGKLDSFRWHVIDWPEGDSIHSHQKHINSGLKGIEKDREVSLLGFYSRGHKGVYTHHSTDLHIHVLSDDLQLAGHVDEVVPGKKFTLLLPS